ncbi:hypothetical protein IQ268_09240 [Oculatella sp. LEGE 06141]|uniref:hypothetical protein n=1 Tax=Oculatella sp. LEGE 06141 TaxID=1828648 RepID=UPI001880E95E|nr:hypothetical protein [Oculatella sp. LEGE 06141]MBE9178743.1 hypothetical protein [Oculatella sp. LEGE 06141]
MKYRIQQLICFLFDHKITYRSNHRGWPQANCRRCPDPYADTLWDYLGRFYKRAIGTLHYRWLCLVNDPNRDEPPF